MNEGDIMAEEKHPGGRPLKFKSAKELQKKIDEYFDSCYEEVWIETLDANKVPTGEWIQLFDHMGNPRKKQIRPFTISGLAVHLETNRQTLLNYGDREEFFDTITRAKARIENFTEEQLFDKEARNISGIQFNLKNNYGWVDKQEVDNNIGNKDGKPFETIDKKLKDLSKEELAQLEHILAKTADSG